MKRWRLAHNRSTASPGSIISFDTETLPEPCDDIPGGELHKLRFGVALYTRLERGVRTRECECVFETCEEFWEWVVTRLHPRIPLWVFAHNLGFDLTVVCFWERLEIGEFRLNDIDWFGGGNETTRKASNWGKGFMLVDDPPTVISCKHRSGCRVVFLDTMNFWPTSLASMGKALGKPKLKMPSFSAGMSEWLPYCRNDTEITHESVLGLIRWVKENDYGRFRYTGPAQAMAAYRHRFMNFAPEFHDESDVRALERRGYYGGRLECFYIGKVSEPTTKQRLQNKQPTNAYPEQPAGPVWELDVASLYPYVMREFSYPVKLIDSSCARRSTQGWQTVLGSDCIADVWVKTQEPFIYRSKELGTIYPIGEYRTTLTGPELERAISQGVVRDCYTWAKYEMGSIFRRFVDHFWEQRREYERTGKTLYASLCKLLLVSLYGKFGQLSTEWEDRPTLEPPYPWGKWVVKSMRSEETREYRIIGGNVQQKVAVSEVPQAFPAIAAYVTAYGREYMRELRSLAGEANVYYLVTDALYVNRAGFDNLTQAGYVADRQLGKLTIKTVGNTAEFQCLHNLRVGECVKRGSVKAMAKRNPDGSYTEPHFQGLRSILEGVEESTRVYNRSSRQWEVKITRKPPRPGVLVYPQIKHMSISYKRGIIQPSGWVTPLVLTQER